MWRRVKKTKKVTVEDYAEAKLLQAVLQGLLEDSNSADNFHRTIALYQEASGEASNVKPRILYLTCVCLGLKY